MKKGLLFLRLFPEKSKKEGAFYEYETRKRRRISL